jgi:hypothetical protein
MAPSQILEGAPQAEVHWLVATPEPAYYAGLWKAQPCRFRWRFDLQEVAHILSGRVYVTLEDGSVLDLRPGTLAHFPRGMETIWEIVQPLHKVFIDTL